MSDFPGIVGIGLVVAAWIVPGVSLSPPGFIVGVLAFAVMQAILSFAILKLPREYATLLLGGTGLALTIVALILASISTHGLTIDGSVLARYDGCGVARDNDWGSYAARVAHPHRGWADLDKHPRRQRVAAGGPALVFCISRGPPSMNLDVS